MGGLLKRKKKKSGGGDRGWPEDGRVKAKTPSERVNRGGEDEMGE